MRWCSKGVGWPVREAMGGLSTVAQFLCGAAIWPEALKTRFNAPNFWLKRRKEGGRTSGFQGVLPIFEGTDANFFTIYTFFHLHVIDFLVFIPFGPGR